MITPGAGPPVTWQALAAVTAGFEPEDDSELLAWMAAEAAGLAAYAEALTTVYGSCVIVAGLDPAALAVLRAAAGAAADAAVAMSTAGPGSPPTTARSARLPPTAACCRWTAGGSPATATPRRSTPVPRHPARRPPHQRSRP